MSLRIDFNAILATEMVAQSKTLNFIVISTLSVPPLITAVLCYALRIFKGKKKLSA